MKRRPQAREWRDDIPRSFTYTPPAPEPPVRARPTPLRLVLSLLLQR